MNTEETYPNLKLEDLKRVVSDGNLFIYSIKNRFYSKKANRLTAVQYLLKIHLLFTSGLGNDN